MRFLGLPYTGYNIDNTSKQHVVLFSYLETENILYIEINDEKLSRINTRKMEVPKYNYSKKIFR